MFSKTTTALLALPLLATAHFQVTWPPSRGFIDDNEPTFPCGGFNDVNATRTMWPMNGAPIQMDMHHTQSNVQILLALGNNPGSAFNYVLRPTVSEQGPNNFCAGMVIANMTGMNITEGMNATIQVVTNGDPNGGLYQCSDITFTSTPLSTSDYNSHCQNSTGVTASFANLGNANQHGQHCFNDVDVRIRLRDGGCKLDEDGRCAADDCRLGDGCSGCCGRFGGVVGWGWKEE